MERLALALVIVALGVGAFAALPIGGVEVYDLPAESSAPSRSEGEETRILTVVERFNRAFAANDPDAYFEFIADEITVMTPGNPYRVEGVYDDREEFEDGIASGRSHVGFFQELQPKVQLYGDVAVVTYFSRGSYGPIGRKEILYLKETDVLVREGDDWRFVHIHVSK